MRNLIDQTEKAAVEKLIDLLLQKLDIDGNLPKEEHKKRRTETYLRILKL